MNKTLLCMLLAGMLAACASSKVKTDATNNQAGSQKPIQQAHLDTPQTNKMKSDNVEADPLTDPNNILFKRSVYFDFDKFDIKPDYRSLIEAHAKYLLSHSNRMMTIEGNADERGSREYNLALGQKRAVAVKQMMNLYGVKDSQIETISFGKEKPINDGHDEAAWAENRRDDIRYQGEKP
jgi:peptidoglycan-associated lipoprotein